MAKIPFIRTQLPTGGAGKAAAGVDYRLHDLKHFFASGLIASGCEVLTV